MEFVPRQTIKTGFHLVPRLKKLSSKSLKNVDSRRLEATGVIESVVEWEQRELASGLAFWCCQEPSDTVSASPQNKATSEITGITASEPSGSEVFFLHAYLGKRAHYSQLTLLGGIAEYLVVRE